MELTKQDIATIAQQAADAAVKKLKKEQQKEDKQSVYHNTFKLLKCYRDALLHTQNAVTSVEQIQAKGITEQTQRSINLDCVRDTKVKTLLMLANVDAAVEEIARRRKESGRECEYIAFEMYFMQGLTYEQIAEKLYTSKNTPRRWVTAIINEMGVLLWGIDL